MALYCNDLHKKPFIKNLIFFPTKYNQILITITKGVMHTKNK